MFIFETTPRERLETGPLKIDTSGISKITERKVYLSDPEDIIQFLNEFDRRTPLDPKNEKHYEIAQNLILNLLTI